MTSSSQLEQRVADLEAEVATLKRKLETLDRRTPWWEQIAGTFENDPIYEQAMQLGGSIASPYGPRPHHAAPSRRPYGRPQYRSYESAGAERCAGLGAITDSSEHPRAGRGGDDIISYEEQVRGWMAYLARARSIAQQVKAYRRLHRQLDNYCRVPV